MNDIINDVRQQSIASDYKDVKIKNGKNKKNNEINSFNPELDTSKSEVKQNQRQNRKEIFESQDNMIEFKTALFGLRPSDVYEYIDILTGNLSNAQQVFDKKGEEHKNNMALLTVERDSLKEKYNTLTQSVKENEEELNRLRDLSSKTEQIQKENEQYKSMISEFQSKIESCKELIEEKRELQSQLAELNSLRDGVAQREEQYVAEISELREINKKQVYTFAQQKNELETKFSNERLRLLKLLQVHTYHVKQSESLLKELKNQFEQSLESLKDINID
ncbi:MAG TPA: hypothetical protein VFD52_00565 [Clostridia bacterium]|nr:hypothetical protein [Clostridia bacterium]